MRFRALPSLTNWGHCCVSEMFFFFSLSRTPRNWGTGVSQIFPVFLLHAGRVPLCGETLVKGSGHSFLITHSAGTLDAAEKQKRSRRGGDTGLESESCAACCVFWSKLTWQVTAFRWILNELSLSQDSALVVHLSWFLKNPSQTLGYRFIVPGRSGIVREENM